MLNETQRKMLQNEAERIRDVVSVCASNEVFILPSGVTVKDVGDAITQALADSDALAQLKAFHEQDRWRKLSEESPDDDEGCQVWTTNGHHHDLVLYWHKRREWEDERTGGQEGGKQ